MTPPLLHAIFELRWHIGSGKAMKEALQAYLATTQDPVANQLREQWVRKCQGSEISVIVGSHLQSALWNLIERGCNGQPTLEALQILETEIERAAEHEVQLHLATLPFKILLPLLLFQFPAYLILLLGPLIREMNRQMGV